MRGVVGASRWAAAVDDPAAAVAADEAVPNGGLVPLALLAAGVALLTIGVTVGIAQARAARP